MFPIFILTALLGISHLSHVNCFEISKTGCPESKGCVSFPHDCKSSSDCQYLVTYAPGKDSIYFEMSAKADYVALGFNDVAGMIGTDAVICSKPSSGASPLIGHYTLTSRTRPSITSPTPSGLFNMSGEYSNGVIKCRFTRNKKPSSDMKYDLNSKHYLIYARGSTDGGGLLQHHTWRERSDDKIDTTATAAVKTSGRALLLTHGALMLIAWVGFASVGMFTARHMKTFWGESTLFKLKVWFQVHRMCMVIVVVATIISTILVFVHVKGWSQIGAHAYIGVVIIALSVLQPVIAFFRPHPGDSNRYIFNMVHRIIAGVAYSLALTNCTFGINATSETRGAGFITIIVFIVLYVVLIIGYEVYLCFKPRPDLVCSTTQDQQMQMEQPAASKSDIVRKLVYVFLIVLAFATCLTLIVLLGKASTGK